MSSSKPVLLVSQQVLERSSGGVRLHGCIQQLEVKGQVMQELLRHHLQSKWCRRRLGTCVRCELVWMWRCGLAHVQHHDRHEQGHSDSQKRCLKLAPKNLAATIKEHCVRERVVGSSTRANVLQIVTFVFCEAKTNQLSRSPRRGGPDSPATSSHYLLRRLR